jgi:hypothetical protein
MRCTSAWNVCGQRHARSGVDHELGGDRVRATEANAHRRLAPRQQSGRLEAPRLNDGVSLPQKPVRRPQIQVRVILGQRLHGQRANLVERHPFIGHLGLIAEPLAPPIASRALRARTAVGMLPGWIGDNRSVPHVNCPRRTRRPMAMNSSVRSSLPGEDVFDVGEIA